jgi:cell division protein FtsI/penicillin-binding protein 2
MRRLAIGLTAVVLATTLVPLAKRLSKNGHAATTDAPSVEDVSISHAKPSETTKPEAPAISPMTSGVDLMHMSFDDSGAVAPTASGRVAKLTIDPQMQRAATTLLRVHRLPRAAIILVDTETGNVLAYASRSEGSPTRDINAEARAPAASVFKIVTGSALVEDAQLTPDTQQCYWGGEHEILPQNLEENPARDRSCTTLAEAMGHSTNTVFAKLALSHLKPEMLDATARAYGFDEPVPFDVPVEASTLKLPQDDLGYARTAAGFWNSTLSSLQAVWLSTTVARGGEAPRLSIVRELVEKNGAVTYEAAAPTVVRRAVSASTAQAVTTMMEKTVSEGTSRRAFHDGSGHSYLPGIVVAGKTGTLADPETHALYTWFTGFAPSHASPGVKQVAVAVLVVNRPAWHIKANVIAREILRTYFAEQNAAHVTVPASVARK